MILDSSAIVAILCKEPDHRHWIEKISQADLIAVGSPTVFEAAMVLTIKLKRDGLALVHEFLYESGITVISFTEEHASRAYSAFFRYGKGRHKAALNFGDCLSYAVAQVAGRPLLFKGDDFSKTDVKAA